MEEPGEPAETGKSPGEPGESRETLEQELRGTLEELGQPWRNRGNRGNLGGTFREPIGNRFGLNLDVGFTTQWLWGPGLWLRRAHRLMGGIHVPLLCAWAAPGLTETSQVCVLGHYTEGTRPPPGQTEQDPARAG